MSGQSYEPVIGLEIHAQISTKTKMFCNCDNDSFDKEPNINTCPICMGFPGTLPVINKISVEKGIKAALALHGEIQTFCKFDRKNYFYPDLPNGYQISQYDEPISKNGFLEIAIKGQAKKIRIHRLHLENDAGKLTHTARGTLCDYNRAGTPLMEIVSEADLRSPEEASLYAKAMQKILRAVDASDCDMEKGMMRFDINVSVRPQGQKEFGTKAEVKNLNSFKSLERALAYEIERQIKDLNEGKKIIQETRGFDTETGLTFSQRTKEEAHDYRYFPEPDLPPIVSEKQFVEQLKKSLPELPAQKKDRFIKEYKLSEANAELLSNDPDLASFLEKTIILSRKPDKAVMWLTTRLLKFLNEELKTIKDCKITPANLAELIKIIDQGEISDNIAKEKVFPEMYKTAKSPTEIIEAQGLKQVTDTTHLEKICQKIIEQNAEAVATYKSGKTQSFGFLIGQAIKLSKGQGNPKVINEIMKKLLS